MKAIVVGAGLAGLSAAHVLRKANWDVVVLEAADRPGGRATTIRRDCYTVERGATQISSGWKEYLALVGELGLKNELVECSNSVILLRGGRQYPIDGRKPWAAVFSPVLPIGSKLRMLRTIGDFLALRPRLNVLDVAASSSADVETAQAYAHRRLDRTIYDVLIDPLIRAYVLNRGDRTSALEWFSGMGNLAGQSFLAMRGGSQRLPNELARTLDVRLRSPVTAVRPVAGGVTVDYRDERGGAQALTADACIVATRLPETAAIAPSIAAAVAPLLGRLRYNRGRIASIGYARRPDTSAIGVLIATVENPHIGLVWLEHNKIAECAPPGHALITCYFDEAAIDDIPGDRDETYVEMATRYIESLFPEVAGARDFCHVSRWDMAIPHPSPGTYKAIDAMKERLDPASPIQIAGDYFTCTGQNSAIHWGKRAAGNVIRHIGRSNSAARSMLNPQERP